jgi:5-formyltetrahydrofolate cyclo-ligase
MEKSALRQRCLAVRKETGPDVLKSVSYQLCECLFNLDEIKQARCVLAYMPIVSKGELDLIPLIRKLSETRVCAIPIIQNERMVPVRFTSGMQLIQGPWNVPEPANPEPLNQMPDVVICPGLAADFRGARLGYGKGYYDAFLSGLNALTVFPVMDKLVYEEIPVEKHDRFMDIVVTEKRLLRTGPRYSVVSLI